ncbi:MAG: TIGR03790 family protein [Fimbriimonadales bacterium]
MLLPLFALVASCGPSAVVAPLPPAEPRAASVLVVWNANAPESRLIAETYVQKRGVPQKNLLAVKVTTKDNIAESDYESGVLAPVRGHIAKNKLKIDFIVLVRGVPIRLNNDGGYSLDAFLMVDAHPSRAGKSLEPYQAPTPVNGNVNIREQDIKRVVNPYFRKSEKFDSDKYGMYLCTRLDGYTVEDAIGLIQRSLKAAPAKGVFLFDSSPGKTSGSLGATQSAMPAAKKLLEGKQMRVVFDEKAAFAGGQDLMGYASWGSNDGSFDARTYHSLSFLPGALAETYVSTSGRTFRQTSGGQSLIADLIRQGVTGVKGYVSEPFTFALARVDTLFDRYTSGFNLAESFYMASPLLKWKDVVIGDPLCSPYRKE